nr:Ty3/gypsy retrotransposon protein [Tanacetum cinerariifolium]
MISRRGVEMDPKKVIAVRDWPEPTMQHQVRGFLRLAGYNRRFIKGYATMAEPFTKLLRKDGFRWGGQEATAFQELKKQLSTTPILSLPDFTQEFVVEADASNYGIGAVLLQHNRPISYFSRKLGPIMRTAATYQKELFAIVESIYKWRQYLVGRRFKIRTDHKSIKELMQDGELVKAEFMAISQPTLGLLGNLKSENQTLEKLQALHQQLDTGSGPDGFQREQGLLIFRNRYYVGHGGVKKMLVGLSALFYWLGMRKSVEDYIKQYTVCQHTKYSTQAVGGFTEILVVVDRFSKYAHFGVLPTNFNGHKVAELFMEIVVKHHGIPKTIVSNRDPIFVSKFWKELFRLSGTQLNHSTAYHPQLDGQTEVVNRGLEQYLRAMVSDRPQQWVRLPPWAEYCYNTSYHSNIKMSPYQALYGRLPLSLIPYPPGASKVAAVDELLMERNEVTRQLKQNLLAAKLRMEEKANRERWDVEFKVRDKVFVKLQPYRQITLAKRLSNKLAKRFYRPSEIVERIRKVAYRLALPVTSKIHPVFHVSIFKIFTRKSSEMVTKLPDEFKEWKPMEQHVGVCDSRMVLQNGKYRRQVLVQWASRSPEEAAWEWLTDFQSTYHTCNLEDKVVSEDIRNVTPLVGRLGRGKRTKKALKWQESFVMG